MLRKIQFLTYSEKQVVAAIRETGEFSFSESCPDPNNDFTAPKDANRRIRGPVLAAMIRGVKLPGIDSDSQSAPEPLRHGVRLVGAWIDGGLDLHDLGRGESQTPLALRFEYCYFKGTPDTRGEAYAEAGTVIRDLDLRNAHIALLSLKYSRFVSLDASSAHIDGSVNCSNVSSAEPNDQELEQSAHPSDLLNLRTGCLRTHDAETFQISFPESLPTAARSEAPSNDEDEDENDATLRQTGGTGTADASNTQKSSDEQPQHDTQNSDQSGQEIPKDVATVQPEQTTRPLARCSICFRDAQVRGDFILDNAALSCAPKRYTIDAAVGGTPYALNLSAANITGSVKLQPACTFHGGFTGQQLRLGQSLWCQGARFSSEWDARSFRLPLALIDGSLMLNVAERRDNDISATTFIGLFDILQSTVGGRISAVGARFYCAMPSDTTAENNPAISADQAQCGSLDFHAHGDMPAELFGAVYMRRFHVAGSATIAATTPTPNFHLTNLVTGGNLLIELTFPTSKRASRPHSSDAPLAANLSAQNLEIAGNLTLSGLHVSDTLSIECAKVGRNLEIRECSAQTISARQLIVSGQVTIRQVNVRGLLDLYRVRIHDDLELDDVKLEIAPRSLAEGHTRKASVDLQGAIVGGTLKARKIHWPRPALDFERAVYERLSFLRGWWLIDVPIRAQNPERVTCLWDGRGDLRVLDGTSPPIHALNQTLAPDGPILKITDSTVCEYLTFFCRNIRADGGPFQIINNPDFLRMPLKDEKSRLHLESLVPLVNLSFKKTDKGKYEFERVLVLYNWQIFQSTFEVNDDTGEVTMVSDESVAELAGEDPYKYRDGKWIRKSNVAATPVEPFLTPTPGRVVRFMDAVSSFAARISPRRAAAAYLSHRPLVNLAFARACVLNDAGGMAWRGAEAKPASRANAEVRLQLEGFTFDSLEPGLGQTSRSGSRIGELGQEAQRGSAGPSGAFQNNARLDATEVETTDESRLVWLQLQFENDRQPSWNEQLSIQPYEHLAQIFRRGGRFSESDSIIFERLIQEHRLKNLAHWHNYFSTLGTMREPFPRWLRAVVICLMLGTLATVSIWHTWGFGVLFGESGARWMLQDSRRVLGLIGALSLAIWTLWLIGPFVFDRAYRYCFEYGLRLRRSLITFIVSVLLGTIMIAYINDAQILVLDETPVEMRQDLGQPIDTTATQDPRICGDNINVFLYALDLFIPIIDLRQEIRCSVRSTEEGSWWKVALSMYALLGWCVTSLTVLTASGIMRRRAGG